jgi:hypothetical protein
MTDPSISDAPARPRRDPFSEEISGRHGSIGKSAAFPGPRSGGPKGPGELAIACGQIGGPRR